MPAVKKSTKAEGQKQNEDPKVTSKAKKEKEAATKPAPEKKAAAKTATDKKPATEKKAPAKPATEKKAAKTAEEKPVSKAAAKKKAIEDGKPKRPLSAYFHFLAENRPKYVVAGKPSETIKKAGAAWKALSEAERKPYEEMAAESKQSYEKEMDAFNAK